MMHRSIKSARGQRGVVLWVALGVLIIMSLAGLAMLRQIGGGLSVAGNIAFKQSATAVADLGTERAIAWLRVPGTLLASDIPTAGYYSTWGNQPNPADSSWSAIWDATPSTIDSATGNAVKVVIQRLCALPDVDANAAGQHCSAAGARSPDRGGGGSSFQTIAQPYFRITTQVTGPRNTVSYIQVIAN